MTLWDGGGDGSAIAESTKGARRLASSASDPTASAAVPARAMPVDGRLLLRVARRDGADRLGDLYMHDPLRVLFPRPAAGDPMQAVLATTSGGLVGGDRLTLDIAVGESAALQLVGQAAEKVYRSPGADTEVTMRLDAGRGALLELLPQGTILFDGARLRRSVAVEAADGARALVGEMLTFGRIAAGERMRGGLLRDRWQVRRAGRLLWADALALEGDIAAAIDAPSVFGGAATLGTVVHLGPDAGRSLELARALLDRDASGVRSGASLVEGVLVARFLSADGAALRAAFGAFWRAFRAGACGLPERLPTIWHV